MRNAAGAVLGLCAALILSRGGRVTAHDSRPVGWLVVVGVTLLGGALLVPGVENVHRWLPLGPLNLHVGAVVLPPVLVMLGTRRWGYSVLGAVSVLAILLVQPDAAKAAAFAAGWCVPVAMARGRTAALALAAVGLLAGATWLRPDPLDPVPHVEGIVGMAIDQSILWGAAGVLSLVLVPLVLLLSPQRRAGAALAAYMTVTLAAAWIGHYPVPFMGYGVAPILGYYLGVVALRRTEARF